MRFWAFIPSLVLLYAGHLQNLQASCVKGLTQTIGTKNSHKVAFPKLGLKEYYLLLLAQDEFPQLVRQALATDGHEAIKEQVALVDALHGNEEFFQIAQKRQNIPLLSTKIIDLQEGPSYGQIELIEVHPYVAALAQAFAKDSLVANSLSYANGPLERVFFIKNKWGEEIGHLSGTMATLEDGKEAFVITAFVGKDIKGKMRSDIFSALFKIRNELKVEEIAIAQKGHGHFPPKGPLGQGPVSLNFQDQNIREIIENGPWANEAISQKAYLLQKREQRAAIQTSTRPFELPSFKTEFSPKDKFLLAIGAPRVAEALEVSSPPFDKDDDFLREILVGPNVAAVLKKRIGASLWIHSSAEARAHFYQAFNIAKMRLDADLAKKSRSKKKRGHCARY